MGTYRYRRFAVLLTVLAAYALAILATSLATYRVHAFSSAAPPPLDSNRVLAPDVTILTLPAVQDTWLDQKNDNDNRGACQFLTLKTAGANLEEGRIALAFDLSYLPTDALILSAQLQLNKIDGASDASGVEVNRLTAAWDEGTGDCGGVNGAASWHKRQPGFKWGSDGGDYEESQTGAAVVAGEGPVAWNVTALVQDWAGGSAPNFGFLLRAVDGGGHTYQFASREHPDIALRPRLVVHYIDLRHGIGNRVWDDLNRDGQQGEAEPGLGGVVVRLYGGACDAITTQPLRVRTTDDRGRYIFSDLAVGDYCAVVDEQSLPAGYVLTSANQPLDVYLPAGDAFTEANFGFASALAEDRLTAGVYAPCLDDAWLYDLAAAHGASVITADRSACVFTMLAPAGGRDALEQALLADGRTRAVGPDVYAYSAYRPNDPFYNNPSYVYGPQQINAEAAWDLTHGDPTLIVAVLDTGVDPDHPEFSGRLLPGWDFANDDPDPFDDNGHGTHVTGILAAGFDNNLGIAGMAHVLILPVKVLDASGNGWWSDVAAGITWAVDQGAMVINLSLTGSVDSAALQDAVAYAVSKGTVVLVAAGNSNSNLPAYPASYDNVLSFGATGYDGLRWPLSNYGPNVDVMAPGGTVYSTRPGGTYGFMSGTSMASPHGAGTAALMLSRNPNLSPAQVKAILLATAVDLGAPGPDEWYGQGRIDAGAAVAAVPPADYEPPTTSLSASLILDVNGNGLVDPGDTLRYRIVAANGNPAPLTNVIVSASLPAHTSYTPASTRLNAIPVGDDAAPASAFPLDEAGLDIGDLPAGGSSIVTFDVLVAPLPRGVYSLHGEAVVQIGLDSDLLAAEIEVAGTLLQAGVDKAIARAGDTLNYTITSDYLGDESLATVAITAPLPAGAAYLPGSASAGGSESAGAITWNLGSNVAATPGWAGDAGSSRQTRFSLAPTLVAAGGQITVTQTLTATQTIAGVTPSLVMTGSNGVSATVLSGPTPASAAVGPAGTKFTWLLQVSAGDAIGQLLAGGDAAGPGETWPWAESNSVLVHPPLGFAVVIDDPATAPQIVTTAFIADAGERLPAHASNTAITGLPASIGDRVWADANGDGLQGPVEGGLAGITVELSDGAGLSLTTNTDANGAYGFDDLPPGVYTVTIDTATVPAPYNLLTTAYPQVVSLSTGEAYAAADIGLKGPATTLGDSIWYDADGDGRQDVGEPGLGNVTVDLWLDDGDGLLDTGADTLIETTVSNAQGGYRLDATVAGVYFVDVTDAHGVLTDLSHTLGSQSSADPSPPLALGLGETLHDIDFGYVLVPAAGHGVIGDQVWMDANANCMREDGESNVIGVEVCATPVGGGSAICRTTDINGRFLLEVPAGDYNVGPSGAPPGWMLPTLGAQSATTMTVGAGEQHLDADSGFIANTLDLGTLGGLIWQDLIVDGLYDPLAEPGIASVSVNLVQDGDGNGTWDSGEPILATLSDPQGDYRFTHLPAGDYLVEVSDTLLVLDGFAPTIPGPDPDTSGNNHAQPYDVQLAPGEINTGIDFGYREFTVLAQGGPQDTGMIGDLVWFDHDGDGTYDPGAGDQPLPGVTLALRQGGVELATATTGLDGRYLFTGLALGVTYEVEVTDLFEALSAYMPTAPGPDTHSQPYVLLLGVGGANMSADFGYTEPASLAGFIYFDNDGDGRRDASETVGVNDVVVTATHSDSGQTWQAVSLNGVFGLAGLPPGPYEIAVEPYLPGLALTSSSPLGRFLFAGDALQDVDFGYIAPTAVTLISFSASEEGAAIVLHWSTGREVASEGFVVWRAVGETGPYKPLSRLIPAANDPLGASYSWRDTAALPGEFYWYRLESRPDGEFFGPIPGRDDPGVSGSDRLYMPLVMQ